MRIHTCRRLIKKQKLRISSKRTGNFKLSLFTVRKVAGKIVSFLIKVKYLENFFCLVSHSDLCIIVLRQLYHADKGVALKLGLIVESYKNVSDNAHIIEKTDILEGSCNALVIDLFLSFARQILTVKVKCACCRLVNTCEEVENRRFTGTVRADKTIYLTFFNLQINILNRFKSAE